MNGPLEPARVRDALHRELVRCLRRHGLENVLIMVAEDEDTSDLAETERARRAARVVLRDWLPRTLELQGFEEVAGRLRDLPASGGEDWDETARAVTEVYLSVVRSQQGEGDLTPAMEGALKGFNLALWARDALEENERDPGWARRTRARMAEEIGVAGHALLEAHLEAGRELHLAEEFRRLLRALDRGR